MFTTIIITKPIFFDGEAERISGLLSQENIGFLHIRKPGSAPENVEKLLVDIPRSMHDRLVLHDHFGLAIRYGLHGIHLNSRCPSPPDGWKGSVSRSCHTLEEVRMWKERCDYVSLSPVFDSVSKQGYRSAFTEEDIRRAVDDGVIDDKVYALGGVTFARLAAVEAMGFGGAMILGDAWRE